MFLFSCLFGFVFPRLKYDFRSSRFCPSRYYGLAVCIKGLPSHPSFILANVAADHANESTTRWPHAAPSVHPRPNTSESGAHCARVLRIGRDLGPAQLQGRARLGLGDDYRMCDGPKTQILKSRTSVIYIPAYQKRKIKIHSQIHLNKKNGPLVRSGEILYALIDLNSTTSYGTSSFNISCTNVIIVSRRPDFDTVSACFKEDARDLETFLLRGLLEAKGLWRN
jgi:hypothetical protein